MTALLAICLGLASTGQAPPEKPCVIVVVGAPGSLEFATRFRQWADQWHSAADKAGAESIRIGLGDEAGASDRDRLKQAIGSKTTGKEPLWLVMIGHGTFAGKESKFNLRGSDVTDVELAEWLKPVERPMAVIACFSSSGPFLTTLSGSGRIVVSATKSGSESNFSRLGEYLGSAIADPSSDLDKDGQVSLLEAYITAGKRVEAFYKDAGRLSTEHALLDDNGDKLGTPVDWFQGLRATKRAKDGASSDGLRAHQLHLVPSDRERSIPPEVRRRRDAIELTIAGLRDQKGKLTEAEFYGKLEPMMVELATLYATEADRPKGQP